MTWEELEERAEKAVTTNYSTKDMVLRRMLKNMFKAGYCLALTGDVNKLPNNKKLKK